MINHLSFTDGIFINRKSMLWKTTSFMMCLKLIMFHSIETGDQSLIIIAADRFIYREP